MGPARKIIKKRKKVWLFYRRQRTAELRPPATFSPLRQPWLPPRISTLSIGLVGEEAEAIGRPGTVPQTACDTAAGDARPGGSFPQLLRRGGGLAQIWRPRPGRGKWTRRMGERRRVSIPSVFVRRRSRARGWQQPAGAPASSYSLVMTC